MFQDLQNEMTAKFLSVQDMIQDQLQMVLEMVQKKVDESNKKMTESWAEITKKKEANQTHAVAEVQQQQQQQQTTQQSATIMKQAVEESKREEQINEDRQCSIVVHVRLKESSKDNVEERKEEERELANRLCTIGARVQGCQVKKTSRLGKYDKNSTKPRPLKISFANKQQQQKVLANLSNLREAEQDLKCLSISPDLSQEKRQEIKQKVEEAKEKCNNAEGVIFRVRGPPDNLRIVQMKKK